MTFISAAASSAPCSRDGFIFEDRMCSCQSWGEDVTQETLQTQWFWQRGGKMFLPASCGFTGSRWARPSCSSNKINLIKFYCLHQGKWLMGTKKIRQCRTGGTRQNNTGREWALLYEMYKYIRFIHTFPKKYSKLEKPVDLFLYISFPWLTEEASSCFPTAGGGQKQNAKKEKNPRDLDHSHYFQMQKQLQGDTDVRAPQTRQMHHRDQSPSRLNGSE